MLKQISKEISQYSPFKFLIFAAIVAIIPFYNLTGTSSMILGSLAILLASTSSIEFCALCVLYTIPFALGVQEVFGGINLNNALQLALIVKTILRDRLLSAKSILVAITFIVLIQFIPLVAFSQTIPNLLMLVINIFLFIIYYKLIRYQRLSFIYPFITLSLGVLISCIVAQYGNFVIKNAEYIEYDFFRFCGLWTDPNFLGAFCNISLATCLYISQGKIKNILLLAPIMLLSLYFGFKTLSFTYIVLLIAVISVFLLTYVKDTGKLFFMGLVIAAIVAPYIIERINDVMNVRIVGDQSDISHGRFTSSLEILDSWTSNIICLLFGFGYNNTLGALNRELASHNSYVDMITCFGVVNNLILLIMAGVNGFLSSRYIKRLLSPFGIFAFLILLMLGTVSGLKYEFVFIMLACYIAQVDNEFSNNYKEG